MLPSVVTISVTLTLNIHHYPQSSGPPQPSRMQANTVQSFTQSNMLNPKQDLTRHTDFLLPINLQTSFKINIGEAETRYYKQLVKTVRHLLMMMTHSPPQCEYFHCTSVKHTWPANKSQHVAILCNTDVKVVSTQECVYPTKPCDKYVFYCKEHAVPLVDSESWR